MRIRSQFGPVDQPQFVPNGRFTAQVFDLLTGDVIFEWTLPKPGLGKGYTFDAVVDGYYIAARTLVNTSEYQLNVIQLEPVSGGVGGMCVLNLITLLAS